MRLLGYQAAHVLKHPGAFAVRTLKGFGANQGLLLAGAVQKHRGRTGELPGAPRCHRVAIRRRHFLVSALIPYAYILCLGFGLLLVTLVAGSLQAMGQEQVFFLGRIWSLGGVSGLLLYLLGLGGEVFVLTSIYLVMPVGRLSLQHALIGAVTAAVLWELSRHVLVWYFATLSQISTVYGSLTSVIAVLLSLEVAATLLLLGAQVISEYERVGKGEVEARPQPFTTEQS